MEPNGVVLHDQGNLVVKGSVADQVVVRTHFAKRTNREGRRLSRSSDGLEGILIFGDGVELSLGRNEVLFK